MASMNSPPSSVYSYSPSTRSAHSSASRATDYSYHVGDDHHHVKSTCNTARDKTYKYLRRILKFRQMDFEFALWQMMHLLVAPQKVYRNFQYRKQTKNQFARDDPAFLVLLSLCFCATTLGFTIVLGLTAGKTIKLLLWVVFIDCVGVGIVIASIMWLICNRYLILMSKMGHDVEWAYAFDVHLNAFFPVLMILHCAQLVFINPVIIKDGFAGILLGNTFWLVALSYYIYITFLGYCVLPFLKKSVALLSPMVLLVCVYVLSLVFKWNVTKGLLYFYRNRV